MCAMQRDKTAPLLLPFAYNSLGWATHVPQLCHARGIPITSGLPSTAGCHSTFPSHSPLPGTNLQPLSLTLWTCHLPSPSLPLETPAMLPPPPLLQAVGPMLAPLTIASLPPITAKPLPPPSTPWHTLLGVPGLRSALPCPSPERGAGCFPASLEPWDASPPLPGQAHPLLPASPRARGAWPGGLQQGTGLDWRGGGCGALGATSGVLSSTPAPVLQQPSLHRGAGGQGTGEGGFQAQVLVGRSSGRVQEGIRGKRHPGGAMPGRGTEADTRSRRPGWRWTSRW